MSRSRLGEFVVGAWAGYSNELAKIAAADTIDQTKTLKARERRVIRDANQARRARVTRRWAIGTGAAVVAGGLYLAVTEIPPLVAELAKSDEEKLLEEVTRLGIQESPTEKALWASAEFQPYPLSEFKRPLSPTEAVNYASEAIARMDEIVSLMPYSGNRLIAAAGNYLEGTLYTPNELSVVTYLPRDGSPQHTGENPNLSMGIRFAPDPSGVMDLQIQPTIQRVLTETPQAIANQLAHEGKHMEQLHNFLIPIGTDLHIGQRTVHLATLMRAHWNEMEAEAYGTQFLAYIQGYGLTREPIPWMNQYAVALIKRGADITSPEWLAYVKRNLVTPIR